MSKTVSLATFKRKVLANPKAKAAYDALAPEYEAAAVVIRARARAGLSQVQLAELVGTSQAAIARIETGRALPSVRTLQRIAGATGTRLRFELVPIEK